MKLDPEIIVAVVVCLSMAAIALALAVSPIVGAVTAGVAVYIASTI